MLNPATHPEEWKSPLPVGEDGSPTIWEEAAEAALAAYRLASSWAFPMFFL